MGQEKPGTEAYLKRTVALVFWDIPVGKEEASTAREKEKLRGKDNQARQGGKQGAIAQ